MEGRNFLEYLGQREGINTQGVRCLEDQLTGEAIIMIDKTGENSIIINGGANMAYDETGGLDETWQTIIRDCNVLLLQREIPEAINIQAAKFA